MKNSIISAHNLVELPFLECVQLRGVPTPVTNIITCFTLALVLALALPLLLFVFILVFREGYFSDICFDHLLSKLDNRGKKIASKCNGVFVSTSSLVLVLLLLRSDCSLSSFSLDDDGDCDK